MIYSVQGIMVIVNMRLLVEGLANDLSDGYRVGDQHHRAVEGTM
jgi:hypothetical protein